jgi:hypothetical protein
MYPRIDIVLREHLDALRCDCRQFGGLWLFWLVELAGLMHKRFVVAILYAAAA